MWNHKEISSRIWKYLKLVLSIQYDNAIRSTTNFDRYLVYYYWTWTLHFFVFDFIQRRLKIYIFQWIYFEIFDTILTDFPFSTFGIFPSLTLLETDIIFCFVLLERCFFALEIKNISINSYLYHNIKTKVNTLIIAN